MDYLWTFNTGPIPLWSKIYKVYCSQRRFVQNGSILSNKEIFIFPLNHSALNRYNQFSNTEDFPQVQFAEKEGLPWVTSVIEDGLALSMYWKFSDKLNLGTLHLLPSTHPLWLRPCLYVGAIGNELAVVWVSICSDIFCVTIFMYHNHPHYFLSITLYFIRTIFIRTEASNLMKKEEKIKNKPKAEILS